MVDALQQQVCTTTPNSSVRTNRVPGSMVRSLLQKRRVVMQFLQFLCILVHIVQLYMFANYGRWSWLGTLLVTSVMEVVSFSRSLRQIVDQTFWQRGFDRCMMGFPAALISLYAVFQLWMCQHSVTECVSGSDCCEFVCQGPVVKVFDSAKDFEVTMLTSCALSVLTIGFAALEMDFCVNSGVARDMESSITFTVRHFIFRATEVAHRVTMFAAMCTVLEVIIREGNAPDTVQAILICLPVIVCWGMYISILMWSTKVRGMPKESMTACLIVGWVALGPNPVLFLLDAAWYSIVARRANRALTLMRFSELVTICVLCLVVWGRPVEPGVETELFGQFVRNAKPLQILLAVAILPHVILFVLTPRLLSVLACRRSGSNRIPFLPQSHGSQWDVQDTPTVPMATFLVNSGGGNSRFISRLVPASSMETMNACVCAVESCIGQGSYGVVVCVRQEERGCGPKYFALKLQYSGGKSPKAQRPSTGPMRSPHEMAMRERDVYRKIWEEVDADTGRVGHPFIVKLVCYADWPEEKRLVYEGSETPVQFFVRDAYGRIGKAITRFDSALLMEYCKSGSLEEYVPVHMRRGKHSSDLTGNIQWLGTARRFFAEILLALDFLHNTKSVIYRDLKLDNVFVVNDSAGLPHVKLGDFGFSKVVNDSDKPTSIAGSPYFAAPEMMAMHRQHTSYPTDWSLDVFSFGMLVFVVLYGADRDDDQNTWGMAHHKKGSDAMHPIHATSGFTAALAELELQERAPASAISLIQKATSREQKERPSVIEMIASPLFKELSWPDGRCLSAIDWFNLKRTDLD